MIFFGFFGADVSRFVHLYGFRLPDRELMAYELMVDG